MNIWISNSGGVRALDTSKDCDLHTSVEHRYHATPSAISLWLAVCLRGGWETLAHWQRTDVNAFDDCSYTKREDAPVRRKPAPSIRRVPCAGDQRQYLYFCTSKATKPSTNTDVAHLRQFFARTPPIDRFPITPFHLDLTDFLPLHRLQLKIH